MTTDPNPNRYLEHLTPENCAVLLIDHQTGTMLGVQDIRVDEFRRNVLALAGTAKLHGLPTVLTASFAEGPNGPLMPELVEMFPDSRSSTGPGRSAPGTTPGSSRPSGAPTAAS